MRNMDYNRGKVSNIVTAQCSIPARNTSVGGSDRVSPEGARSRHPVTSLWCSGTP